MKSKIKSPSIRPSKNRAAGVLCGTDFSPAANQAAEVAAALARRFQTSLELLHATARPADPQPRETLRAQADRLRQQDTLVQEMLAEGNPDEELVKAAKPSSCRLVVVASLGKRGAARWLLGSVAERTAERARVPTLVVRDAAPMKAWTRGERPLRVFVAFNFSATSEAALRWVKELQAIGPCEIVVGFVDWLPEQRARLGRAGALSGTNHPLDVQGILERDLKVRVTELLGTTEFKTIVETNWGRPDSRLTEIARKENADVIVVGSHQYRGFEKLWRGSTTLGLLHGAKMSVVIVPLVTAKARRVGIARPVQRVLVTTDFSAMANCAIPHAYGQVHRGGTVHLVHVIHPHELSGGKYLQGLPDRSFKVAHATFVQECAEKLRALIPPEALALSISTEVEVTEHHEAATGILQAAERVDVDLICLGTHGGSGLIKSLVGSVTQKVMAKGSRPLLVVPPPQS